MEVHLVCGTCGTWTRGRTLFQDGEEVVQLLAVDGEQVLDEEAAALLRPAHRERLARRAGVEEVDDLLVVDLQEGGLEHEVEVAALAELLEQELEGAAHQAVVWRLRVHRAVELEKTKQKTIKTNHGRSGTPTRKDKRETARSERRAERLGGRQHRAGACCGFAYPLTAGVRRAAGVPVESAPR